jgi:SOS-response transcriptional repressor LexA
MDKTIKKIPEKYRIWIEARKRHKLTDLHIQMARELGMNPKKFGKIDNHKQEQWKTPLPEFIKHCYQKRFKREFPIKITRIEDLEK